MGTYLPQKSRKKRSISQALREAEEEHLLDCPNADPAIRTAAFLLDIIFLYLATSSLERIIQAVLHVPFLGGWLWNSAQGMAALNIAVKSFQIAALYYAAIWSVYRFGGTPAKLIFGLRVVDASTGQQLSFLQTVLREIFGKAFLISMTVGTVLVIPIIRRDHLALHDIASRSVVKRLRHTG